MITTPIKIPISFDMYKILENNLSIHHENNSYNNSKYLVQMCSQAKTSGTSWKFME